MTTGLSIPEINSLVADGATIADDGTIQLAAVKPVEESTEPTEEESTTPSSSDAMVTSESEADTEPGTDVQDEKSFPIAALICIPLVCVIVAVAIVAIKRKRKPTEAAVDRHDDEGGVEQ